MKKKKTNKKRNKMDIDIFDQESDENFYYIAGYTDNGFAYGITWDEAKKMNLLDEEKNKEDNELYNELPF